MDGGIEFLQAGECHSFYVKVNGIVEKLYGIFYQSLVLGVTHTGGIDRTAVIFGKSGEIIIDDRLVAVASCDGSLQIVGDDSRRNAFKILNGILTCLYQVFLALRPYGFAVGRLNGRMATNTSAFFVSPVISSTTSSLSPAKSIYIWSAA